MSSCIVCGKFTVRLFNVFTRYGVVNHTVFDDVTEIFGNEAKHHLTVYDCVCNVCMNMLDNVAMLRRHIWKLITTRDMKKPHRPVKLGKIWNIFATLKIDDLMEEEVASVELNRDSYSEFGRSPSRSSTPLLKLSYNEEYDAKLEERIAREVTLQRDRGRMGSSSASLFKRRRRKKGHNWSHVKGRPRSKSVTSGISSIRSSGLGRNRPKSRASTYSSPSNYRRIMYDDEDRLIGTKTRWVSKEQEQQTRVMAWVQQSKMYCRVKDCPVYFEDLDVYNQHMIEDHESMALFYCEECDEKYSSEFLLKKHMECHDNDQFHCLMCSELLLGQAALQQHLDEHLIYSISCQYCDKSFLSMQLCQKHIENVHQDEQKRRRRRKRKLIIEVVNNTGWMPEDEPHRDPSPSTLEVRCYSGFLIPGENLDVTEENLKTQNITFYSEAEWMQLEQSVEEENVQVVLETT